MRRCGSAPTGVCLVFLAVLSVGVATADESSWSAPPGRVQLAEDPQLIPKGKGMLFVPMMSVPHGNEPSYQIYRKGGAHIGSASPGSGVLLPPGSYRVRIGSGAISQMIRKTVEVMEGSSTLLKPDWSALVIDVIDQTRTPVSESYELYQEETQENFGQGLGIEEERGEKVRTWILKPGVYHVVKVGESFSTIRKFSVRLEPGKLVQRDLVYDDDSGNYIGFYARPVLPYGTARIARNVTSQTELSGSTLFHTSQNTAGEDIVEHLAVAAGLQPDPLQHRPAFRQPAPDLRGGGHPGGGQWLPQVHRQARAAGHLHLPRVDRLRALPAGGAQHQAVLRRRVVRPSLSRGTSSSTAQRATP